MHELPRMTTLLGLGLFAAMISIPLLAPSAKAEWYVAGQFGVTLPSLGGGLSNIDVGSPFIAGTTHSDLALKNSILYGGKIGYYFRSARWFGLETEVFNTNPHIKEQTHTFNNPSGVPVASATLQGAHLGVTMWSPLNVMLRYPKSRLQPYIGFGPGIFFARIKGEGLGAENPTSTSSNGTIGLNAKAGVEYYMTRHFSAFVEWKYNYARFSFSENPDLFPFPYAFKATYSVHNAAFGLAYHF
ncbi:MAG TPA: outer membrane beta-barrel protein [Nitrospira sp.]|nr:outer membrane beta-barrel protein [Nitrospira sp.]